LVFHLIAFDPGFFHQQDVAVMKIDNVSVELTGCEENKNEDVQDWRGDDPSS
jgi:hypothetical protein